MSSERMSAIIDDIFNNSTAIDKLIERIHYELNLGYYDDSDGRTVLRKVLKWANKYKEGDD